MMTDLDDNFNSVYYNFIIYCNNMHIRMSTVWWFLYSCVNLRSSDILITPCLLVIFTRFWFWSRRATFFFCSLFALILGCVLLSTIGKFWIFTDLGHRLPSTWLSLFWLCAVRNFGWSLLIFYSCLDNQRKETSPDVNFLTKSCNMMLSMNEFGL